MVRKSTNKRISRTVNRAKGARLRGQGGYLGDLWNSGKKLLPRAIGGAVGVLAGRPQAGWDVGGEFSKKVLGWGDYSVPWSVSMNSLVTRGQAPAVANIAESGVRLSHREYIGTLYSTTTFTNNVYYLNPGLTGTFPWLSKMAANFQQYQLLGAVVTFKSALTEAVASFSSLGSVMIAADMNSAATPASSQLQLEQMQFVASAKPSQEIVAPIECAPVLGGAGVRYIRSGTVPASASILDYDHCIIQVATTGQPTAGVELGRLYLSYDVKLLNPKMLAPAGSVASYSYTPVSTYPFGVTGPTKVYDNIGLTLASDGTGYKSITIPPASGSEISVDFYVYSTADLTSAEPTISLTNLTSSARRFPNASYIGLCPTAASTTKLWCGSFLYRIVDQSLEAKISVTSGMPFASAGAAGMFEMTVTPAYSVVSVACGHNGIFAGEPASRAPSSDDDEKSDLSYFDAPVALTAAAAGMPLGRTPGRRP